MMKKISAFVLATLMLLTLAFGAFAENPIDGGWSESASHTLTPEQVLDCCEQGYRLGFRTFVLQGGEWGDERAQWVADIVSDMRRRWPDCAITLSLGEHSREVYALWRECGADRYLAMTLMNAADETVTLSEHYYPGCYRARNAYMVERSRRLIAVVTDSASGTGQTIRMAKQKGLELRLISLEQIKSRETEQAVIQPESGT